MVTRVFRPAAAWVQTPGTERRGGSRFGRVSVCPPERCSCEGEGVTDAFGLLVLHTSEP